jgi:hypothetical protein
MAMTLPYSTPEDHDDAEDGERRRREDAPESAELVGLGGAVTASVLTHGRDPLLVLSGFKPELDL